MNKVIKRYNHQLALSALIILLIVINIVASLFHARIDFTNEKRFTISSSTKKVIQKTKDKITIDVFLKGNYPSGFKKLASSTEDLLRDFQDITSNKIQYHFISPSEKVEGTDVLYSDTLAAMGLLPINLTAQVKGDQQQQYVYPFALVHFNDRVLPVEIYKGKTPLINFQDLNNAEAMLEYNFANAIAKIQQETKPEIGYAIGNGEPMDYSVYDLAEMVLKPNYNLSIVNLSTQKFINPDFKALLIVKPKNAFTDQQKLEIDQYLMNGGKLLFFVDRLNAEMDSLQIKNQVIAYDRELGLNDLLFRYGVRINPNLVMDLQCDYLPFDVNGNGQFEFLPWNYFPVLESSNNHPINKNLGFVAGRFVNSIDTSEVDGIKKTVLLQTSVNGRIMGTPALISGTENSSAPEDEKFKTPHIPVAVLLEGKFKSFFANRLSSEMQDTLSKYGMTFMPYASHVGKLIVAGDGDLVLNQVVKGNQPLPMGMNAYTYGTQRQFPFANKEFLLNSLDYLIDENGLSEAKGKEYIVRLLDTKKVNAEKMYWQMLNIFSPILLMGFFTFIINWIKKRKYTNK